ncbi:dimethyl sulfoxide reductase anchor subunit family protein [Streptomyces xiamenensis]|uniref:dimethyl sulfoxide reductase anchor subunit family protein n=1 Tax=Streptomyces xiamenensis TaxID=408015 RepID=UPI0035DA4E72
MHPAFSVIFFTTLSGAGYGLMMWLGALALLQHGGLDGAPELSLRALGAGLLASLLLVTAGLLSSTAHLGKPLRSWRASSQWRTSWLSREGVMAVLTYAPALTLLAWLLALSPERAWPAAWPTLAGTALSVCALLTVACTAMIYASLPPIPAWRHPLVVPVYLAFAALSGAALLGALPGGSGVGRIAAGAVALLAPLTALLKWRYWAAIDRQPLPASRGDALGLPGGGLGGQRAQGLLQGLGHVLGGGAVGLGRATVVPLLTGDVVGLQHPGDRPVRGVRRGGLVGARGGYEGEGDGRHAAAGDGRRGGLLEPGEATSAGSGELSGHAGDLTFSRMLRRPFVAAAENPAQRSRILMRLVLGGIIPGGFPEGFPRIVPGNCPAFYGLRRAREKH